MKIIMPALAVPYLRKLVDIHVSDDRPSEPENGESTDYRHLLNHKQNGRRGRRSLSSLMKGTFYISLVQCVVSYSSILIVIT
jgi:hypothetical protein